MVQIICPNCDAKYNVPEAALGPKGRKVSCANCGNAWHAMPVEEEPMLLSDPVPEEPGPATDHADETAEPAQSAPEAPSSPPAGKREERARQLAEIRQIVDEVQTGAKPREAPVDPSAPSAGSAKETLGAVDKPKPELPPEPPVSTPSGASTVPFPEPETAPDADNGGKEPAAENDPATKDEKPSFLKALTGIGRKQEANEAKAAPASKPEPVPVPKSNDPLREKINSPADKPPPRGIEKSRKKMLRKHNRRVNKRVAREKRGAGAFTTGVLLILIVVAFMAALYLLAPQISAQAPAAEPALQNYISKVDEVRAGLGGLAQQAIDTIAPVFSDE